MVSTSAQAFTVGTPGDPNEPSTGNLEPGGATGDALYNAIDNAET